MNTIRLWVPLAVLLVSIPAHAQIYKWTDAEGKAHFSGAKPDNSIPLQNISNLQQHGKKLVSTSSNKEVATNKPMVELFVTSWCPYCKKAKNYLNNKGIAFKEYDIEADKAAADRMEKLSPGSGIPVAVIRGVVVQGFDEESYDEALAKN